MFNALSIILNPIVPYMRCISDWQHMRTYTTLVGLLISRTGGHRTSAKARSYACRGGSVAMCFVIVCIPVSFIYVGYFIGSLFMPPPPRLPAAGIVMDMSLLNYTWYNTHNITASFAGGLGNQMFQYAALYGIGKANGLKPIVCGTTLVARTFRLLKARRTDERDSASMARNYGVYAERKSNAFDSRTFSLNFMRNIVLDGFFQSWRYFDHVRSDVRKQFQFRPSVLSAVDAFLHESAILAPGIVEPTFVGVHVRRGDMLEARNVEAGYTVADAAFVKRAIRYYEKKHERVVFVVCSDDPEWSTQYVRTTRHGGSVVVYSRFAAMSPDFDLALMAKCNHSIITVGTFGWWGAWLAGGDTVYYRDYPRADSTLRDSFRLSDYYLPKWIAM